MSGALPVAIYASSFGHSICWLAGQVQLPGGAACDKRQSVEYAVRRVDCALIGIRVGIEGIPGRFLDGLENGNECWRWEKRSGCGVSRAPPRMQAYLALHACYNTP